MFREGKIFKASYEKLPKNTTKTKEPHNEAVGGLST